MATKNEAGDVLEDFVAKYVDNVRAGFDKRWAVVTPEIYSSDAQQCIGGLLSRQAVLTIEMAVAPSTWNGHVAPLFLRCMVDAYIALAWILESPDVRSEKYIKYGLGQEKLFIAYLEEAAKEESATYGAESLQEMIDVRKAWLNSQLSEWATEVNVGAWSGMTTREMAKAIGRESIYKHAYVPFSGVVHNMWQHVAIYNMKPCTNPLHKRHWVPKVERAPVHIDFMYRSAKYVSLSYEVFDKKMGVNCDVALPETMALAHPLFSAEDDG